MKDTYHATVPFAIYQSRTTYPTRKNTPLSAFSRILLAITSIKGARYQHHARWVPSSLSWFPALSHIPYSLRDYSLPVDQNVLVDPETPSLSISQDLGDLSSVIHRWKFNGQRDTIGCGPLVIGIQNREISEFLLHSLPKPRYTLLGCNMGNKNLLSGGQWLYPVSDSNALK